MTLLPTLAFASHDKAVATPPAGCSRPSNGIERLICRQPDLTKIYATIGDTYASLRGKLDAATAAALATDQKLFITAGNRAYRSYARKDREKNILDYLNDRAEVLGAVNVPAPQGFVGTWMHTGGRIDITTGDNGAVNVALQTGEPLAGRWMCVADGSGTVFQGSLMVKIKDSPEVLLLSREGQTLNVKVPVNPYAPRHRAESSLCTKSYGSVSGRYFSVTFAK